MTNNASEHTQSLQCKDRHFLHPWEDVTATGTAARTVIAKGDGIYITDSDGKRMIDGPGGMWCVNVGYGREEIVAAVAAQMRDLSYFSPWSVTAAPAAILAERLAALAPGDLNNVFFTTGGSTAVDSALRFAFFYNNCLGRPEKKHVIARVGAYHGSTYLSASCSGKMLEKANMDMIEDRVHLIPNPNPSRRPAGMSVEDFCDAKVADLENKILELGPDKVAAFIAEPVLASGGVIIPPKGYFERCHALCRKYDVLFIADEVVTAFGRLGSYFASKDVFGVEPDMLTTAKGLTSGYLPLGALFISDRLLAEIKAAGNSAKPFFSGFTYSGHPVAAAAGLANLDIFESDGLLDHARSVAPHFRKRLQELADLPVVCDVRVAGLMGGVECSLDTDQPNEERDMNFLLKVDRICQQNGLLLRPIYATAVMSPPLTISKAQIDEMVDILKHGLQAAAADL
ncbi:aminotransferase [Thalassovita mangrovi]|uniref:Aminotransferase n=1 Tax=Thalassovita mangrovi TaxID=2692236 RepID=A0A6L8LI51_9RHOB|nr:aminotransferase [Thalassovita mangrovi]MYM55515.1 aminotransferase [Thalassovita mangrovi]